MSHSTPRLSLCLGLLTAALVGAGCGASDPGDPSAPAPGAHDAAAPALGQPLASLRLADGAQVDFYEPEAGRVLVIASGALQIDRRVEPSALYQRLSGQPAPAALVQAETRAALAREARAARVARDRAPQSPVLPPRGDGAEAAAGVGQRQSALSATDFQAAYCPGGVFNFYYCWTNRTGDGTIDVSSVDWLRTYTNPYRGQITLKLSYKNLWGTWITLASITAPQDTVKTIYTADNDTYRVEINQGAGDGWHWSVYGQT